MAPNNHTDHDSAARTTQGVSAMSQPDAWLFQPTRTSIFFDLHQHIVFCERQEEHELMNIGRFFLCGGQMAAFDRADYDRACKARRGAYERFLHFTINQDEQL